MAFFISNTFRRVKKIAVKNSGLVLWCLFDSRLGCFTIIALSSGLEIKPQVLYTRIGSAGKRTQNIYHGRVGVNPGVSGSHGKHSCLQVSSSRLASYIQLLSSNLRLSLVSLPYNNNNNNLNPPKSNWVFCLIVLLL